MVCWRDDPEKSCCCVSLGEGEDENFVRRCIIKIILLIFLAKPKSNFPYKGSLVHESPVTVHVQ